MSSRSPKPGFWQLIRSGLAALLGVQSEHQRQQDFNAGFSWRWVWTGLLMTALFIIFVMLLMQGTLLFVSG